MDTSSLWRLSGGLKNLPMNLEAAAAPALPPWTLVGVAHFSPSGVLLQTSPRVCVLQQREAGPQLWPQHRPPAVGWDSQLSL